MQTVIFKKNMISIHEKYKQFSPPLAIRKSIERMLTGIPSERISGLHSVILINSKALNRKQRRTKAWAKKKKYSLDVCRGLYYKKRHNEPAYIQIIVDNILLDYPNWIFKSRFVTDIIFSETLFHEIGHHIHDTQAPEHNESEDVANKWKAELSRKYFRKQYWLIVTILLTFREPIRWIRKKVN